MSRRIPALLRRGGRGSIASSGGASGLPPLGDTSVETGYANTVDHMATSNFLPATDDFTLVTMFTASDPTGAYGMIFSKGFAASGWYITLNNSLGGRVMARLGGATPMSYYFETADLGKTFALIATRTASVTQMWLARQGDRQMIMVAEDLTPGSLVTNSAGPGIGNYQNGTTGSSVTSPMSSGIIACAYGSSALSDADIQQLGLDMLEQGTIPTDFTDAVSVYQASGAGGMAIDQVGSNDLTTSNGESLSTAVTSPTYPGDTDGAALIIHQSNALGDIVNTDFSSIDGTNYETAFAACRYYKWGYSDYGDLVSTVGTVGTGIEVSLGREMSDTNKKIWKHAVGGTDIDAWTGPSGAQFIQLDGTFFGQIAADTPVLNTIYVDVVPIGGEADAVTDPLAAAYGTKLIAFKSALWASIESFDWVPNKMIIPRLSDAQVPNLDATRVATVQGHVDTFAAANSDVFTVNTDSLTTDDGLHYDAGSLVGLGVAVEAVRASASNQSASPVT